MPPKRKDKVSGRTKWTNQMVTDVLDCRDKAMEEYRSRQDTTDTRGRKGYMEIMKRIWEERGYASLELTAQNLRDRAAYYERKSRSRDVDEVLTEEIEQQNHQDDVVISENIEAEGIETTSVDICINENANVNHQPSAVITNQSSQNQPEIFNAERERQTFPSMNTSEEERTNNQHHPSEQVNFSWDEITGNVFCQRITTAYEEIVHWKRNNFLVPSGKVGKSFIREVARLYQSFADDAPLECIALKACSVMQSLLLQKPHAKSKAKEHTTHLERRMKLWLKGDIDSLLREGRCIQKQFKLNAGGSGISEIEKIARGVNRLMIQGKVRQAIRLISNADKQGLLSIDELIPMGADENGNITYQSTREILKQKHPEGRIPPSEALLEEVECEEICHDPIIFERITGDSIKRAANRTQGAAGPSGIDAYAWRRFCFSFKGASVDLCNALAGVARRLCTSTVHPESVSAFVSSRLIPLNKNPGVRPIGIGEVPRRIIAKSILKVIGEDVQSAAGPLQTCAGHEVGCEAAVHAMKEIQESEETEAILLVDAENAFNTINRHAALHNIKVICPSISTVLNNTYSKPIRLFVTGGGEILSTEGITQGDPLAMAMYALAITPLIRRLKEEDQDVKQVWFADDSTAGGRIRSLWKWWQHLMAIGPIFGYFPNSSKTTLLVKPEFLDEAVRTFEGTDIKLTTEGQKLLGSAVGTASFIEEDVANKVEEWVDEISKLAKIAEIYPHSAYAAFTHGIMGKWQYTMRTNQNIGTLLQPLEDAINEKLIPALTGRGQCSPEERKLLSLPTRHGGLNIMNPTLEASAQFMASKMVSEPLKEMIIDQVEAFSKPQLQNIKANLRQQKNQHIDSVVREVGESLPIQKKRAMDLLGEKGSSSWLTALPIKDQGFSLNKSEFRDAISLRYGWQLRNIPQYCICGKSFSADHAMICPHGGLIIARHNEIRDLTANWLGEICSDVEKEPQLQPLSGEIILPRTANKQEDARVDIRARGFWGRRQSAYFDVRVFHPNAQSYRNTNIHALYRNHEQAKKREYGDRIREVENASFTPLVFSTTGGIGKETSIAYKRMAELLAIKRNTEYSTTLAWMRCSLSFALIRSAVACIRGTRTSPSRQVSETNIELSCGESRLSFI